MDDGISLYLILGIAILVLLAFQFGLARKRKKQKEIYPKLWEQFQSSKRTAAHEEILEVGNKLVFNNYVPTEHLEIIQKTAEELLSKNPEFEKLKQSAEAKLRVREYEQGKGQDIES